MVESAFSTPIHIGYCPFLRAGRVFHGDIDGYADPDVTVGDAVKVAASITGTKYDANLVYSSFAWSEMVLGVMAGLVADTGGYIRLPALSLDPDSETLDVHARPKGAAPDDEVDVLARIRDLAAMEPVSEPYLPNADENRWNAERRAIIEGNIRRWRETNERLEQTALNRIPSAEIGAAVRPYLEDAAHAMEMLKAVGLFGGIYGFAAQMLEQNAARSTSWIDGLTSSLRGEEGKLGTWVFGIETAPSQVAKPRGVKKVLEGPGLRWARRLFEQKGRLTEFGVRFEKDANGRPRVTRVSTRVDDTPEAETPSSGGR